MLKVNMRLLPIFAIISLALAPIFGEESFIAKGGHGGHHHGGHHGHHGHHHGHDGHHGHVRHHWHHAHHHPWWHHSAHPGWHHHHWQHWNNYHHPWHDWYWYGNAGGTWGNNPGYFYDPNYYYYPNGNPSIEYEFDESQPVETNVSPVQTSNPNYNDEWQYSKDELVEEENPDLNDDDDDDEDDEDDEDDQPKKGSTTPSQAKSTTKEKSPQRKS